MFLRNAWYVAAWANELGGTPLGRTLLNEPVVLFRDTDGKVAALEDRCCHRGAALSMGVLAEAGLQCGYHGLTFNGEGRCVLIPGQSKIPDRARIRSYPVVEKNEFVWIWMGEPDQAAPELIVDYPYNEDHVNWPHNHAMMAVQCNYQLLIENLMDLTHLGYVHTKTIGGDPRAHVEAQMKVTRTEYGIKYIRWMLNAEPPPTYKSAIGFKGRIDRWQEFEYYAPSNVLQYVGALDAGTGAYDQGKRDGGFALRVFHAITPETDDTSFYFWTAANGYRRDDPQANADVVAQITFTFDEDKLIIEAQQKRLKGHDPGRQIDIDSDGPRLQMHRHLCKLIEAENLTATMRAE
jgi:phenylpropionate dioxygenase-like ring-hydroxylating dioxygenase large terminal subunit